MFGGDGAVMMQLDGDHGDGGRSAISGIDGTVPPNS